MIINKRFLLYLMIAMVGFSFLPSCAPLPPLPPPIYTDPEVDIEDRVEDLLLRMTLGEKLEQMAGNDNLLDIFGDYGAKTHNTPDNERLGIPGIKFTDGPRGVMLNQSTCFPVSIGRGATWDPELEERVGTAMGLEARAQGANMYGSPCINIVRHPGWGRAQETYGADSYHVGIMGSSLTRGLQRNVMACAKHFAANSIENTRFTVDVQIDERTLREIYLPHFKVNVEEGIASIMSAYNKFNGYYCSENSTLLRHILKDEWGFDGFVISDFWLGTHSPEAVNAGLDIEMPSAIFFSQTLLLFSVLAGTVPVASIDEAVTRILRQKFRFCLFDDWKPADPAVVASSEHQDLALEVARKAAVLLKNENGLLPLDQGAVNQIAVIGYLADRINLGDTGSSDVTPPYVVTLLQGIMNTVGGAVIVDYYDGDDLEIIRSLSSSADAVIIVTGLTSSDEGEFIPFVGTSGGDRNYLGLNEESENLIDAATSVNNQCIVVLEGGSAITMASWVDKPEAILMAWYPGMEGGSAIAEILFGQVNPSGKLPLTFPKSDAQLYEMGHGADTVVYGPYHDYRYFDREGLEPGFCFGHGLSYTSFEYSNLRLDKQILLKTEINTVLVDVINTGERFGEEIVQLYIGYQNSQVERPAKELKGFVRVGLEPGERKTVTLEVDPKDLAYYNPLSKLWEIEETAYELQIGASSRDIRLTSIFEVISQPL